MLISGSSPYLVPCLIGGHSLPCCPAHSHLRTTHNSSTGDTTALWYAVREKTTGLLVWHPVTIHSPPSLAPGIKKVPPRHCAPPLPIHPGLLTPIPYQLTAVLCHGHCPGTLISKGIDKYRTLISAPPRSTHPHPCPQASGRLCLPGRPHCVLPAWRAGRHSPLGGVPPPHGWSGQPVSAGCNVMRQMGVDQCDQSVTCFTM
jgi:hypothetical protein